jgi:hypothetical protein
MASERGLRDFGLGVVTENGICDIAIEFGVGTGTVQRIGQDMRD